MNVQEVLDEVLAENNIVVNDTTFELETIETIKLETGEMVYWIRDGSDRWLSIDPEGEEIILFNDVEELDTDGDVIMYGAEDYEFSLKAGGSILEDDEEVDRMTYRDFEGHDGSVLRVVTRIMSNEVICAVGIKIPEEQLQLA